MQKRTKAIVTLSLLSPVLAELLSGSSPALKFFLPWYFLLQWVSYGIPVLIMRELAVKWKLGISGIFILGLGYGIFNEGIITQTFFLKQASFFPFYGYYFGMHLAWVPFAAVWHSLHSILYPILLTYFLYPEVSKERWLTDTTVKFLFAFSFLETLVIYFSPHLAAPVYFFVFWAAIFLLAQISKKYTVQLNYVQSSFSKSTFFAGFATVLFYFGLIIITKTQATLLIYWLVLAGMVRGTWWLIKVKQWAAMPAIIVFVAGDYVANSIFAVVGRHTMDVLLTSIIISAWLIYIARKPRPQAAVINSSTPFVSV